MPQHDYNIANQRGLEFLQDLNNALQAIVTQNSGTTEPTTTYPGMIWLDTSVSPPVSKQRNQTNDGWITTVASESVVPGTLTKADRNTPCLVKTGGGTLAVKAGTTVC